MPASFRPRLFPAFLALAVAVFASCAAPLGPRFTFEKHSLDVHYLAGEKPRLAVRASYRMKNTGNRRLAALEVRLPGETDCGRQNLRATLDGGTVSMSPAADGDGLRISFPRPWAEKEGHGLVLEYELTKPLAGNRGMILAGDNFFLSNAGWFPVLRPPEGLFAEGDERQKRLELSVRVPDGFLAHASGKSRGTREEKGEIVYRFRMGKEDFDPFVVAGRYFEQQFSNADATILFWTLQAPLPQDQLQRAGAHLSAAVKVLETSFGPLSKKPQPYWTVQAHSSPHEGQDVFVLSDGNFPRGALYDGELSAREGGPPLGFIEIQLAGSWFQQLAGPRAQANPVLPWALGQYAAHTAEAEAHGDHTDRPLRIRNAFQDFDASRGKSKERTLLSFTENDPIEELRVGFLKAGLLLDALEDRCGKETLRRALRHMVQSLRGSTYGYNELRSALEQECHQDLGAMFREWLTETGIPADFRRRYENKP